MPNRSRRTRLILAIVLGSVIGLTALQVTIQKLRFPTPIASNILIFALVNINTVLLLLLVLLIFRSLFKVYLERRENVLGSKIRVKLAVAFVSLALLPAGVLFLVASNLITTSVDSWFNVQIEESLQRALEVAQTYSRSRQENALSRAKLIAGWLGAVWEGDGGTMVKQVAAEKVRDHSLDGIQVFNRHRALVYEWRGEQVSADALLVPTSRLLRRGLNGEASVATQLLPNADSVRAMAPVFRPGTREVLGAVAVVDWVPAGIGTKAEEIQTGIKEYQQLRLLKGPTKGIYLMLFLMVTLVIIFGAIWVGVHLARGITGPIQQLAEGTRKVAAGDLNFHVQVKADDEIGMLVDSFNKMTGDLSKSKTALTEAYQEVQRSNVELDRRRDYMETVLETITAGVLSLDAEGRVNTVNQAAARMLGRPRDAILNRPSGEVLAGPLQPLERLVRRAAEAGQEISNQQVTLSLKGRPVALMVTVSMLLGSQGESRGLVLVMDDVSEVLRAQQVIAWREMAQRVAHEIKNPLTPIQLSTQRLRKKFAEGAPDAAEVFDECTRTIIQEVEGLRHMVDEFSQYARMPALRPRATDLGDIVQQVMQLYAGVKARITVRTDLDPTVPRLNLDPDMMRRALINLVENAIAAVGENTGEIVISTHLVPGASQVVLEVADDGPGFPPDDRDRAFLPYYSTKRSSGGLGLAIVHRIILEHGGDIRIEDNQPRGARLVITLPALVPASV
ncbi:MAG TPA: ATP-binding protein [Candidatus Baltobacteraceae bacterium]|nr:ATP-binding protein [Candidatus Baltobacteraceae bacterium]